MKYRTFGRTGFEVSALGFGAMRMPVTAEYKDVDRPAAIEMIRYAIDHGVNYVDTAYPYHGGNSELVVGEALRDGYREKVALATKLPIWDVQSIDDCDRFLDEQLEKLQTDHIDYYLLHCVDQNRWPKMRRLDVPNWGEKARADGRIGELGFSYHDNCHLFREVIDAHDWSFCQIQYNYVGEDVQAGTEGLEYAASKGVAVVIMEPLFGGSLANPPREVQDILTEAGREGQAVDVALQWLWNKPEVTLVLSGMSSLDQVKQNVASASRGGVGTLGRADLDLVARLRDQIEQLYTVPCTKCGYCMPCPNGVDIPVNFGLYNEGMLFKSGTLALCQNLYRGLPESQRAESCIECGACEEKCPQQIPVREFMPRVHEKLK